MVGEITTTVTGNLTADPELRFTPSGAAVSNFTIANTPRKFDRNSNQWKDQETLYVRCTVWREYAENVAESLAKGAAVVAYGTLKARSYETREGEKRTAWEMEVLEVGPSLRYATANVTKNPKKGGGGGYQDQSQSAPAQQGNDGWGNASGGSSGGGAAQGSDPWGTAGGGDDEPPF